MPAAKYYQIREGPPTIKAQTLILPEPVPRDRGQSEGQLADLPAAQEWEDWADPSQMVVWLSGKKTSGPVMGGCSHTQN